MDAPTTPATRSRLAFHASIDTDDLARSSAFYRALFGAEPVLVRRDYARFGPGELGFVLGLVLVLDARRAGARDTGGLRHLGVLFPDAEALRAARQRLDAAGFPSSGAEHVECCYAELDQYWVSDPSGVRWELFLAHEEVLEARSERTATCCAPSCCS